MHAAGRLTAATASVLLAPSMTSMRQRRVRGVAASLLALLLLVPLLASAHRHGGHASAPCAVCAVAQHTPVVSAPAVALPTPGRVVVRVAVAPSAAPVAPSVGRATERGPPAAVRALGS
jgi:hypothetical protein